MYLCFDLVSGLWGSDRPIKMQKITVSGRCHIKRDPSFSSHLSDLVSLLFVLTRLHPLPLAFNSSRGRIKLRTVAPSAGMDLLLLAN